MVTVVISGIFLIQSPPQFHLSYLSAAFGLYNNSSTSQTTEKLSTASAGKGNDKSFRLLKMSPKLSFSYSARFVYFHAVPYSSLRV